MLEQENFFEKPGPELEQKPEDWTKLEQSADKTIQEMIGRGILSLEKISSQEIKKDERNGRDSMLFVKQKENGVIKEKIIHYNSRVHPSLEYAEYTEKLTYEFGNGVVIHFESFLPSGWKLNQSRNKKARFDVVWERVEYEDLEKDLSVFGLLHEIGHVLNLEKLKKENPLEYKETLQACKEWGSPFGWPKEKYETILRKLAPGERNAWAIALNIFRVLKNNDLFLEKKDISPKELQGEITNCLTTYQKNLEERIFIKNSQFIEKKIKKIVEEVLHYDQPGRQETEKK